VSEISLVRFFANTSNYNAFSIFVVVYFAWIIAFLFLSTAVYCWYNATKFRDFDKFAWGFFARIIIGVWILIIAFIAIRVVPVKNKYIIEMLTSDKLSVNMKNLIVSTIKESKKRILLKDLMDIDKKYQAEYYIEDLLEEVKSYQSKVD
jgi:glucan phosphoethanolaminetransferase (alkaline phosphatase superfamily)